MTVYSWINFLEWNSLGIALPCPQTHPWSVACPCDFLASETICSPLKHIHSSIPLNAAKSIWRGIILSLCTSERLMEFLRPRKEEMNGGGSRPRDVRVLAEMRICLPVAIILSQPCLANRICRGLVLKVECVFVEQYRLLWAGRSLFTYKGLVGCSVQWWRHLPWQSADGNPCSSYCGL